MMKKVISVVAGIAVAACCFMTASFAGNDYVVLYENNFDDGVQGKKYAFEAVDNEYFMFTPLDASGNCGAEQVVSVVKNGNLGIAKSYASAYTKGRTLWFDFTKGEPGSGGVTPEGTNPYISSGFVKISFDFSVNGSTAGNTETRIGYNMNRKYNEAGIGNRMITIGGSECFLISSLADSWSGGTATALEIGQVYNLSMVMDFAASSVYYYLDGTLIGTHTNLGALKDFSIGINGDLEYFDNLKIEKYESLPMTAEIKTGEDGIFVEFSDALSNTEFTEEKAVLKNVYTGEEKEVSLEVFNSMKVKVDTGSDFAKNAEYILTLPDGIEGISGGVLEETEYRFSPLSEAALKSVKLVDVWGTEIFLSDENAAECDGLILEFTEDVNVSAVLGEIFVKNGDEDVSFEAEISENKAILTFDDVLTGNSEYKMVILENGELSEAYDITLKTKAGMTAIKNVKWFVGNKEIETASEINKGDTLDIKVEFINTTGEAQSFLATSALYNGLDMTGFAFLEVDMEKGITKTEKTLSLVVNDTQNLKAKAFVRKGLSLTMPLNGEGILE